MFYHLTTLVVAPNASGKLMDLASVLLAAVRPSMLYLNLEVAEPVSGARNSSGKRKKACRILPGWNHSCTNCDVVTMW